MTQFGVDVERGVVSYLNVKLVAVFQEYPEEVYMWKAEVRKMP